LLKMYGTRKQQFHYVIIICSKDIPDEERVL